MKVIFLDFDGVLNSVAYERTRIDGDTGNLDETRFPLLKRIVDETQAVLVLSTSWRYHWEKDETLCDSVGLWLNGIFAKHGLIIYGKTPQLGFRNGRRAEILAWLADSAERIERFVILDDDAFGWEDLGARLVKTSPYVGRGLEEEHVKKAIELLNG